MKRLFAIILSLSLCIALSSCAGSESGARGNADKTQVFQVGDYPVWVTLPTGWEQEADSGNFDLQCSSPAQGMYFSVFGFSGLDLSADQSARSLFEQQSEQLLSVREHVREMEPVAITETEEKILYSALYSAELDGVKNYYQFFFVHFKSTDDMAWMLFSGMPSVVDKNREAIASIVESVQNSEPNKEP